MIVTIRDVSARCAGCGGTDFEQQTSGALRLATVMTCTACGRDSTYRELLDSIGEEAMRRANEAFAKLKRKGGRRKKPRK